MTCELHKDLLLAADLGELRGEGEGTVAVHIRSCPDCRREAGRVLALTTALGGVVRRRRRVRVAATVVPIAVAAGLIVSVWPWSGRAGAPEMPAPSEAPRIVATTSPPPALSAPGRRSPRRLEPVRPFQPVALLPVPLRPTPLVPTAAEDGSRKPPRVLTTSDPSITVLWFD